MSVVGIDLGGQSSLLAQTCKGGVDCILNESSNRQTAVAVGIAGKSRSFGDEAAQSARSNMKQTFKLMKTLVGRQFDEPEVQKELERAAFHAVKMPGGAIGVQVEYDGEQTVLPMEHVLAMSITKINAIAKGANGGINIADAVIAVPSWFTDAQRRAYNAACQIANLNCIKLINESTAVALSYGIYKSAKKLFSETDPVHIMFIDVGYTGMTVSICDFIQERLIVRATECARSVGGRYFDDVIVELMCAHFEKKTGINVRSNKKAMLKLQLAAEKGKKQLSPNGVTEVNINVECLAEDMDCSYKLTKEVFEKSCTPMVDAMEAPITACLEAAGLQAGDIAETEVVGGTSRIPQVKQKLANVLGLSGDHNNGLKTTMNADEAATRGAALQCAMESVRVKVKPFSIVDKIQYGITVDTGIAGAAAVGEGKDEEDGDDTAASSSTVVDIYQPGDDYPRKPRSVTFRKMTGDFTFSVDYAASAVSKLPEGAETNIGKYTVKVPAKYADGGEDGGYNVRVIFSVDKFMCLQVKSAQLMEPVSAEEAAKEDAEEAKASEGKDGEEKKEEEPAAPKRRFRKIELEVETKQSGMSPADIKNSLEMEARMAHEDMIIIETANKRNELESYIYSMRDRVDGDLQAFATETEASTFKSDIMNTEEWLYGDGFEATKREYTEKIDALKAVGNKLETRLYEDSNRKATCDQLRRVVQSNRTFCDNDTEAYAHITDEERGTIRTAANEAENWLFDMLDKQGALGRNVDPLLTCDMVSVRMKELFSKTNPIMTKPKPKPKEEPKEDKASTDGGADENADVPTAAGEGKEADTAESKDSGLEGEGKMDVEVD